MILVDPSQFQSIRINARVIPADCGRSRSVEANANRMLMDPRRSWTILDDPGRSWTILAGNAARCGHREGSERFIDGAGGDFRLKRPMQISAGRID